VYDYPNLQKELLLVEFKREWTQNAASEERNWAAFA